MQNRRQRIRTTENGKCYELVFSTSRPKPKNLKPHGFIKKN